MRVYLRLLCTACVAGLVVAGVLAIGGGPQATRIIAQEDKKDDKTIKPGMVHKKKMKKEELKTIPAVQLHAIDVVSVERLKERFREISRETHKRTKSRLRKKVLKADVLRAQPPPHTAAPSTFAPPPTVDLTFKKAFQESQFAVATHPLEAEPSVAVTKTGKVMLVTSNTFAGLSTNGGQSFSFINPAQLFPQNPKKSFFCDQVVIYDAKSDMMLWYMQHKYYAGDETEPAGNLYRVAFAKGEDVAQPKKYKYRDFTPQALGGWDATELDFPDISLSDNNLYVTTNVFDESAGEDNAAFRGSVVARMPLAKLAATDFEYDVYTTVPQDPSTAGLGGLRGTRGAGDTMYFGSNGFGDAMRIHVWKES